jgi:hypothetical protein
MSITDFIIRTCTQTAVYWGTPVNDGQGGKTFADPVEIYCRWEEIMQIVSDSKGNEITSRALVYLTQDVDEDGMLYLGTLDDLDSAQEADPMGTQGAYTIKRFEKLPALGSTTEFLRKAYLTPQLSFGGF